eukprot:TRINITY_DN11530_c0_g1_i1.p1 TRINITY_DN11530_c0_g1~~TRINITY_DN11530_c0_g1_i1.p1  ORF type:complete len:526 (-),score=79.16 TRINITY_DN11530_c0_g1_i1:265-1638(-)
MVVRSLRQSKVVAAKPSSKAYGRSMAQDQAQAKVCGVDSAPQPFPAMYPTLLTHGGKDYSSASTNVKCSSGKVPQIDAIKDIRRQRRWPREDRRPLGIGFEAEVVVFVRKIHPTSVSDVAVDLFVRAAADVVESICPEAILSGNATTNLIGNDDISSLEVDINIALDVPVLARRLEAWSLSHQPFNPSRKSVLSMNEGDLTRMALRIFTKHMALAGFYVYHHCAYAGEEPKVCLRVPSRRSGCGRDVFVSFYVNGRDPEHWRALLLQCQRLHPRGASFTSFLRRWARDRGIAYAAKGHLGPFAWTVLSLAFLQQRVSGDGGKGENEAKLFIECIDFLKKVMDPHDGSPLISVRFSSDAMVSSGATSAAAFAGPEPEPEPPRGLASDSADDAWQDAKGPHGRRLPQIEDPFAPTRDLGSSVNAEGVQRLWEELERAANLVRQPEALSVAKLLEHWSAR